MKVIFVADQIPEERQYALILVAGGEEAYNHWDTLEDTFENVKDPEQVWDAFEKSFEQSTSFWHFRDAYLADFRQDPTESTADLDLHIKQTVMGAMGGGVGGGVSTNHKSSNRIELSQLGQAFINF